MDAESHSYTSLHDYLDTVFHTTNPSDQEIIAAKKEYWRQWYKHYRRKRRQQFKEVTIRLHPEILAKITRIKGDQTLSRFVYEAVYQAMGQRTVSAESTALLHQLQHHLMQLIDQLDEVSASNALVTEALIERIEAVEGSFAALINRLENENTD